MSALGGLQGSMNIARQKALLLEQGGLSAGGTPVSVHYNKAEAVPSTNVMGMDGGSVSTLHQLQAAQMPTC